ncbi:aspartyl-tRNA(Asn)/glutamyl-tRNA(Gln) amidotransferase subunit A [Palleronia aestuarii]|uniref:Aspartyl-tRNA(Asn)/glutamyl-tRNA(Gln) amidotransferase subunit A n=1 Tax=Palleronia aestuarii TaxID=568105 RepID=A0A2W7NKH0_9RHOB|nr:amidase [Palleronia aestuarii]PZX17174.1 aspartyl-tRNA(Asn)/glutamyl-tRNA(Gln) amidotransferase subunit A [Palleronia aestuarii]
MSVDATTKTDLGEMGAGELSRLYASGEASPVEAVRTSFERIARFDGAVNAFVHLDETGAMEAAHASEARWKAGEPRGPLDGAAVTIKELTPVEGWPWRRGSALLSEVVAGHEILIVERLRAAGAVLIGATASPELGWKGLTHGPFNGNTVNPWNTSRASGGSSGGAAVAAALNMGTLHEGSDGAGSIRIPGSFCGVFGIKPTFGWIPADAPSPLRELAHRGPLTRSVADSALFLNAVTGASPRALYGDCPPSVPDWTEIIAGGVNGLRVGLCLDLGQGGVEPDVRAAILRTAERLADLGVRVDEVSSPFASPLEALQTIWFAAESASVDAIAKTEADRAALDPGLRAIADKGREISARRYIEALATRAELKVAMAKFHTTYDALLTPTMPRTALPAGIDLPHNEGMSDWTEWSPFTYPFNLTGQPAVTVPCGFDAGGLPIGAQFAAARFRDEVVLRLAAAYQGAHPEPFPDMPRDDAA